MNFKYRAFFLLTVALGLGTGNQTIQAASDNPVQPSFRERYNALAKTMAPALVTRDCTTKKSIGQNRDTLIECPLVATDAQLTVSGLNNKFTGAILELNVQKLDNSGDIMKAGRILLRLARGKDTSGENPAEMMQIIVEAQQHSGKSACEDVPEYQTRFCVMTNDKKTYHLAVLSPEMWKKK